MNVLDRVTTYVEFLGEDGASLRVGYDNRGEPYRQGITLCLEAPGNHGSKYVFIDEREAKQLKVLIETIFPEKKR